MTQLVDYSEFQELRNQFNLLEDKLSKQKILNEQLLQDSMKNKLSHIEWWYHLRFWISALFVPTMCVVLFLLNISWWFILLFVVVAMLQLVLDYRCYKTLDPKNLPNCSLTEATERVTQHKGLRSMSDRILVFPTIVLVGWAVLIAVDYTWNWPILGIVVIGLIVSYKRSMKLKEANRQRLADVLRQIEELRG